MFSPLVFTPHPRLHSQTPRGLRCEIRGWHHHHWTCYQQRWEEIYNFQNNLLLNVSRTKELIVDFRKEEAETHTPVNIRKAEVEQVNSFRFLGTTSQTTSHCHHTSSAWLKSRKGSTVWGNSRRMNFRAGLWSVSTEERQKASSLETSQSGMVCVQPRTSRLCSGRLRPKSLQASLATRQPSWQRPQAATLATEERWVSGLDSYCACRVGQSLSWLLAAVQQRDWLTDSHFDFKESMRFGHRCHLEEDTEDSAAVTQDCRAASSPRLWERWVHHSTLNHALPCSSSHELNQNFVFALQKSLNLDSWVKKQTKC